MPSRQLTRYLTLRESGASVEAAAEQSGIGLTEARFTEQAIEKGELKPEPKPEENTMMAGHNSVAADQLRLFIERVERLEEEKKGLSDDIRGVYSEAKSNGYDTKTMRRVIRLRKMETHAREEAAALLETYASALGLQGALPL